LNVDDYGQKQFVDRNFQQQATMLSKLADVTLPTILKNPTKYWIPTGDSKTLIPARNYIMFWADGKPTGDLSPEF
jgi:hypothetical protein